ncbi:hypothetical protein KX262_24900 [Escherichia coli]|nr:hypothetical protein [Escherichia coli]
MYIFIERMEIGRVDKEMIKWEKLGKIVGKNTSAVIGYSWLRVRLRPSV